MTQRRVAVILFSHGSLLCGSGAALDRHAATLRGNGAFVAVEPGYLNYSQPSIEEAVEKCRTAGADRIIVVPFFLVAGKFVRQDLPARLGPIMAANDVEVVLAQAIEDAPGMETLVYGLLEHGEDPADWQRLAINRARDLCEMRESCPLYGSSMCKAGGDAGIGDVLSTAKAAAAIAPVPAQDSGRRGLLMILHGSPRPAANKPALDIADRIRSGGRYDYVQVAYLECNEPDVPSALIEAGAARLTRLDVLPYFLHPGRHMVLDVANHLLAAQQRFATMEIKLCPAIGESEDLADILLYRMDEANAQRD